MHYPNIVPGVFHARPNRFIAHIEINGQAEICHVKNTGRCQAVPVLQRYRRGFRRRKACFVSSYQCTSVLGYNSLLHILIGLSRQKREK